MREKDDFSRRGRGHATIRHVSFNDSGTLRKMVRESSKMALDGVSSHSLSHRNSPFRLNTDFRLQIDSRRRSKSGTEDIRTVREGSAQVGKIQVGFGQ